MEVEAMVKSPVRRKAFADRDAWNRRHPVGTLVEYTRPGGFACLLGPTLHRTRGEAFVTHRNVVEVYLEGKQQAVAVKTLKARA